MRKVGRFIAWGMVLSGALAASADGQTLTGPQVMERCRKAYDALKSYRGTTKVTVVSTLGGGKSTYNTSAVIQFARPGRIHVEGTTMFGGKYGFVSDGSSTWKAANYTQGQWQAEKRVESAVASFTGVAMSAPTVVPALLLQIKWGNPFALSNRFDAKVASETILGKPTYRVTAVAQLGNATYWVDQKTFLLVKMTEHRDFSKGAGKMPQGSSIQGAMDYVHTFLNVKTNETIAPSVFVRPTSPLK